MMMLGEKVENDGELKAAIKQLDWCGLCTARQSLQGRFSEAMQIAAE